MNSVNELLPNTATSIVELPEIIQKIKPESLPPGYPVPLTELVFIKLLHWGFDDKEHIGSLIVHRELAQDILEIFTELHLHHFPIERMHPIYEFGNDDYVSMDANNSSGFHCREVTGHPGIFSQHAYGRAVDINPRINPYINKAKDLVLPESGRAFLDREKPEPGKITEGSLPHRLFTQRGWDWGNWNDIQDYQHFEKRAHGERRDPDGYVSFNNTEASANLI